MEKEKKSNTLVVILIIIIIGLVGFIVYDKVINKIEKLDEEIIISDNIDKNGNNEQTQKDNEDGDTLIGEYFYITDDEIKSERLLDLMEDGTFYYFTGATCGNLGSGNYEIQNNILILYFKFRESCTGELYMAKNDFYTEDINIHSAYLDLKLEYIINDDKTLSPLTDTNTKIQKTSDSYDNLYKYYNQRLIMAYATLKKSSEQ